MPRFLIVVSHENEHAACVKALSALEKYGSHFVTHAEFGCNDGAHAGWLMADMDSLAEAKQIVPPEFRADARIVQIKRYTREQIKSMVEKLEE